MKTAYGARGDGSTDDSDAFQKAFSEIGNPGKPGVLYVPAGTYKITKRLDISLRRNISVIGENAANTIVRWAGAAGGEMVHLDSVPYSRFGRITWDGANLAKSLIVHGWYGSGQYGGTSYFEHADEIFKDAEFGIRGGTGGLQEGETAILRCAFYRMSKAGLSVENYNALDWYIWDSIFDSNYYGVTNTYGAGNFQIYSSMFLNSRQADVSIDATSYFALRQNYSSGSRAFFVTSPVGSPAATVTFQKNTIVDTQTTPIQFGNPGPVILLDNVIRSASGQTGPVVSIAESYTSQATARLVALGNTYTVSTPYSVQGQVIAADDKIVSRSALTVTPPQMPQAPPSWGRRVFDVPAGSTAAVLQEAINAAAALNGQRPVVHLGTGVYKLDTTVIVPPNSDLQLVGDAGSPVGGTQIVWAGKGTGPALYFSGPSRAIVRDLSVVGTGTSTGIVVDNADQAGGRIFAQQFLSHGTDQGALVDRLDNAEVIFHNIYLQGNGTGFKVVGGPGAAAGTSVTRPAIFAGFSGDNQLTYDVDGGGYLNAQDMWYEGAPPRFLQLTGAGHFLLNGGVISAMDTNRGGTVSSNPTIELSGYQGDFTIANAFLLTRNRISVDATAGNVLALGIVGPSDNANYFTVTNSSAKAALLHSKQFTKSGGSVVVPDQLTGISDTTAYVKQMLAPLRAIQPKPFGTVAAGATDIRFYRVAVDNHAVGLTFRPGEVVEQPRPAGPPAVAITAPSNGATVAGTIDFTASVTAAAGLGTVELKLDGATIGGTRTAAPYSASIDTKTLSNGTHQLSVVVTDAAGQTASATISVTVSNVVVYSGPTQAMVLGYQPAGTRIRQDFTSWVGGWFQVGSSPLTVTALGRLILPGSSAVHPLKLVRVSDNTDVPGSEVGVLAGSCTPGDFCYASLPAPITLDPGTAYYLVSYEVTGSDPWYDLGPVTANGTIKILGSVYKEPQPGGLYQQVPVPNVIFGPLNLKFAATTPTYDPPSIALTSPAATATVSGTVVLTSKPVAAAGIAGVQYKLNGANLGDEVTAAPYSRSFDSKIFPNAAYQVTAVVRDASGATATSAAVTMYINNQSEVRTGFVTSFSPGTLRNNSTQWVGMNFTTGGAPLTIKALGRVCVAGNSGTHPVKLSQNSVDVPGGLVNIKMAGCTPGSFQYADLAAPLTLPAFTTYNLSSYETAGGDQWYDLLPVKVNSIATVPGPIYWDTKTFQLVPLTNFSFGPLDFQY